ncbi:hypothetical protein RB5430 [Rhodopirellula baltica SH 1]|uniref:Uncharacterized protein n=1 Tax=Rhodopirellula baltica (strain DSM 10527 / NCIMB 13988 / SH1) TaxID=243090 RepID=Q7URV5_RHOBA|nr:hypothetical protein RB5430 [Rhodopirellula baltica SH 1]
MILWDDVPERDSLFLQQSVFAISFSMSANWMTIHGMESLKRSSLNRCLAINGCPVCWCWEHF